MIKAIAELGGLCSHTDAGDLCGDQQLTRAHAALHAQLRNRREGVGQSIYVLSVLLGAQARCIGLFGCAI